MENVERKMSADEARAKVLAVCAAVKAEKEQPQGGTKSDGLVSVAGMEIDPLAWIGQLLDIISLYRNGYSPNSLADGVIEKYRQWDIPDKYRLSEYKPCESSASEAQPLALPAECVECGKAEGPVITVGADCLGWLCPECYGKLQQLGVEAQREEEPQASPVEMPEPLDGFEEWWEPFRSNLPPTTDALRNASFCQVAEAAWKACKLWAEAARKEGGE